MIILDTLLVGGLKFVLGKIATAVDAELSDDTVWREELLAAQMRLELGEITEAEFAETEKELLGPHPGNPGARARPLGAARGVQGHRRRGERPRRRRARRGPRARRARAVSRPGARCRPPCYEFIGGKGGVGKTTTAAALALAAAGAGRRTLVVSTDPAHSLGDALGRRLGARVTRIPGAGAALDALELDAERALARWLRARRGPLRLIAERGTYLDERDVDRFLDLALPRRRRAGRPPRAPARGRVRPLRDGGRRHGAHRSHAPAPERPGGPAADRGRARRDAGQAPLPAHPALGPGPPGRR